MSPFGFRIFDRREPFASTLTDRFAGLGSAQIGDCMGRLYGVRGLAPVQKVPRQMIGTAVTVKTRPGDNLMIHKAIAMSGPGDVIVVDAAGDMTNAVFGELMMLDAQGRGINGIVIDGAIRDVDTLSQSSFPCFARGVCYCGPYKDGPGEINVPVSIGGQVVMPGDLIVGDADGVIAIPADAVEAILEQTLEKEAKEAESKAKLAAGTYRKPWVDATIAQKTGAAQ